MEEKEKKKKGTKETSSQKDCAPPSLLCYPAVRGGSTLMRWEGFFILFFCFLFFLSLFFFFPKEKENCSQSCIIKPIRFKQRADVGCALRSMMAEQRVQRAQPTRNWMQRRRRKKYISRSFFLLLFFPVIFIFLLSKELHKCLFKLRAGFSLVWLVY